MRFRLHSDTPGTTNSVTAGSTAAVSSGAVFTAIDNETLVRLGDDGTLEVDGNIKATAFLTDTNELNLSIMQTLDSVGKMNFLRERNSSIRFHTIEVSNSSVTSDNYMSFKIHDTTGASDGQTEVLKLQGDGKVGIGITAPSEK